MDKSEWEAVAAVVEAWAPGVAVVDGHAAVATEVDGVLRVDVTPVRLPAKADCG